MPTFLQLKNLFFKFMKLEDYKLEILKIYKYALSYIGVDFSRSDVQEALEECFEGMEEAFQATIEYWKRKNETLEYPSKCLIKALYDQWKPNDWKHHLLLDSRFKSPCQKYWEDLENYWGKDLRNTLIADVVENERGNDYILFTNGRTLNLATAHKWGWSDVLDYALEQRNPQNITKSNFF
jgi:hypothetical protein